ncbi:response regulator transcription factor [Anaerobaca lacustris]|uniref:Response regulator n=1 Tax=Anaerobaca lacustris TaxID=3044600 RepID=A0AAW6U628_9BACT|nr:response regulator [Sedimentisphaerales bacterium M17dextr]
MRDREGAGRRQEADVMRSLTQVFYADGEKRCAGIVRAILGQLDVQVTPFRSAAECLDCLRSRPCQLLISNARRPGVEGLELLLGARRIRPSVPVIVLVDHGDIEAAVCMMKAGAADCLERPPETGSLVSAMEAALQELVRRDSLLKRPLSPVKQQVLDLVLQGCTNREIALRLHRSARTIEVHRSHILHGLEGAGIVDLVKKCARLGLLRDWPADPAARQIT